MHAVAHDDHPGDTGYTGVLHLLVWVAVPPMRVTVAVRMSVTVRLGLASVLLGGWRLLPLLFCRSQRRFVRRWVGRLQFCELRVVVTVVAGDSCIVGVWRREPLLWQRPQKQSAVKRLWLKTSYLHWGASGAATLHPSDDLTCGLTTSCQSFPRHSSFYCPVSRKIILNSIHTKNQIHARGSVKFSLHGHVHLTPWSL